MLDVLRRSARPLGWALLFSGIVALAVFVRSSALDSVFVSRVQVRAVPGDPATTSSTDLLGRAAASVDSPAVREVEIERDRLFIEATATEPTEAARAAETAAASASDTIATGSLRRLDADIARQRQAVTALQAQVAAAPAPARADLEAQLSAATETLLALEATPPDRLELVGRASVPDRAEAPRPARDAAVGFAAALLLSAVFAFAAVVRSDRFARGSLSADVVRLAEAPLLAVVAGEADGRQEAVAAVRGALLLLPDLDRLRTLAVVTPDAGDAASELVWSLSASVASLDVPVCVIDANLRDPRQHLLAEISREPGFADALGEPDLASGLTSLQRLSRSQPRTSAAELPAGEGSTGVSVVAAGAAVRDPMALLTAGTLRPLLESPPAELVVVDTPTARSFPDAVAIAPACDATLLVVDPRRSRRRDLADLARQLRLVGARVAGVVAVVPSGAAPGR